MIISIINHTNGKVSDEDVQEAIRAINRQIREDYEPYWHIGAELRLEGRSGKKPSTQSIADMRGDAVLYLWDSMDVDAALGYHDLTNRGVPYGFVFTEVAKQLGEAWTVTLSHEALEMVGDSEVNLLVQGPHPSNGKRTVFHWYEMCDAVQAETYEIDGVKVSNFLLPLYFTGGEEKGGRNDFLGRAHHGKTLRSFGVNPGGYIGFFDPEKGEHETFMAKGDKVAARRWKIKSQMKRARRGIRYQRYMQ
ncbi:MAG: hypothetical protein NNA21_09185 [Nitrospira sp.]|nr:hypothetical protein [Nitrospira sp.]MCP9460646.1 hypothetical protein [Nitrospira sp.]MCP9475730.1 hypothetical protein [Nitrospira sp.]